MSDAECGWKFDNPDPTLAQMLHHLRRANAIALRAQQFGHHPFGAILVAPLHPTIRALDHPPCYCWSRGFFMSDRSLLAY